MAFGVSPLPANALGDTPAIGPVGGPDSSAESSLATRPETRGAASGERKPGSATLAASESN